MKTDRKCLFAAVMAVAMFGFSAEQLHVTIFADGAYEADIVVPENVGGVEKYAVEELVYHFGKAFGKKPEIVGEDKLNTSRHPFHIYLGATKAAAAAATAAAATPRQSQTGTTRFRAARSRPASTPFHTSGETDSSAPAIRFLTYMSNSFSFIFSPVP